MVLEDTSPPTPEPKTGARDLLRVSAIQLRKELPGLRGFSAPSLRKMRTFYEEWRLLSDNSFVESNKLHNSEIHSFVATNKLPSVQLTLSDFPISAFMNIGFSHHYVILSKAKDVEQRMFYIQFAADTMIKVEDLEKLIEDNLVSREADECLSVRGKQSGAGDEADVAAVFIHHGEVPRFGVVELLGCLLERVGHIEHSGRGFHE